MRLAVVLLLLGAAASAGCTTSEDVLDDCPEAPTFATPSVGGPYMQTDPTQTWQTLVLAPADTATRTTTLAWNASAGWDAYGSTLSAPGEGRLEVGTVETDHGSGMGNVTLQYKVRTDQPGCRTTQPGFLTWDLAKPKAGDQAVSGQGVHVMTAGFLENGTLFYTNIPEIDTDPRWPHVSWYQWEGDMSLPVYVYDKDRDEQPAYWRSAYQNVDDADVPPTGTPLDPVPYEYAEKADHQLGTGFFTTIPGFNAALKGLSTTTTHVVRLAPEEAYTRPGYEDHVLFGQPIVFYIKVLDVVDAPCPADTPAELCRAEPPLLGHHG